MALTDVAIRALKANGKLQKISDGEGLQIWVTPQGSKLWRLAFRFNGSQKVLAIGTYPEISIAEARKQRMEAKALLASGIDPSQQKRLDKLTKAISDATTFKAIGEECRPHGREALQALWCRALPCPQGMEARLSLTTEFGGNGSRLAPS